MRDLFEVFARVYMEHLQIKVIQGANTSYWTMLDEVLHIMLCCGSEFTLKNVTI